MLKPAHLRLTLLDGGATRVALVEAGAGLWVHSPAAGQLVITDG